MVKLVLNEPDWVRCHAAGATNSSAPSLSACATRNNLVRRLPKNRVPYFTSSRLTSRMGYSNTPATYSYHCLSQ